MTATYAQQQRQRGFPQQPAEQQQPAQPAANRQPPPVVNDHIVQTHHTVKIGGQEVKYTATAGTLVLRAEDNTPRATFFFVAYTKDDVADRNKRPVTFAFNGGPGSATVWLHLGALGPKRVATADEMGNPLPAPYSLVDNEYSILDVTDVVLIDAISTGFSRPVQGQNPAQFYGVDNDAAAFGDFMRLYVTRYGRWLSPKYIIGESYGTTRAAALSGYLQNTVKMYLNGIVLLSSMPLQTLGSDQNFALTFPTYTAIAWYHKKLPKDLMGDLKKTVAEAEQFAMGEYTTALMKGDTLPAAEKAQIVKKMARLTGLSPEFIEECNLRISAPRFRKELLRSQRRIIGRLDARFTGIDRDAAGENPEYDPSDAINAGAYTATINDYLRNELKFETDLPYQVSARVQPWGSMSPTRDGVMETLREAMTRNPFLKVFIIKGYYDMACFYFPVNYMESHLYLDPSFRDHIQGDYFETGHMVYIDKRALKQFKEDMVKFIK
jgi:carboxypeptidase C (cathepsin A)